MAGVQKILALQFKYLGDTVFITPALRAIREHWPACELHALLADDAAPLLENIPWLTRVWTIPRTRGRARLRDSWPVIRDLRRMRFDRSIDFAGNDRGAIMSWLSGARDRLGPAEPSGFWGRKKCYTLTVPEASLPGTYVERALKIAAAWNIPAPRSKQLEIHADPALARAAGELLPEQAILCHIATSNPKKEWPLAHWAELLYSAAALENHFCFSAGPAPRERALLDQLKQLAPAISILPAVPDLRLFLAVLKQAEVLIAGDTGPLHFATALGVPAIGLFGVRDSVLRALPVYEHGHTLVGGECTCNDDITICQAAHPCMASIPPQRVLAELLTILKNIRTSPRL